MTGTYAWTTTQQAIGALNYMSILGKLPSERFGDPANCLRTALSGNSLRSQALRQLRCELRFWGNVLAKCNVVLVPTTLGNWCRERFTATSAAAG
jgi:hypothetical protein